MEDGQYLKKEDQLKLADLKRELLNLKGKHEKFAQSKTELNAEDKEKWRSNSMRMNQIHIEIKDLRHKNVLEAGK